jgi:hypothetical protein
MWRGLGVPTVAALRPLHILADVVEAFVSNAWLGARRGEHRYNARGAWALQIRVICVIRGSTLSEKFLLS